MDNSQNLVIYCFSLFWVMFFLRKSIRFVIKLLRGSPDDM